MSPAVWFELANERNMSVPRSESVSVDATILTYTTTNNDAYMDLIKVSLGKSNFENMGGWKSRGGKSQRRGRKKKEHKRRERVRAKKNQHARKNRKQARWSGGCGVTWANDRSKLHSVVG